MNLSLPTSSLSRYKSPSQRARVATESWAESNLFCPNCTSNRLTPSRTGAPAIDYLCPNCDAPFQLKSAARPFSSRIIDAAYSAMLAAIRADRTPNLFALHYDPDRWLARNLFLIPRFAFPVSAIYKRPPLAATARRAGWIGCDILLDRIPIATRIPIISDGVARSPRSVRAHYNRLRPLADLRPDLRGWTLDVLSALHSLTRTKFVNPAEGVKTLSVVEGPTAPAGSPGREFSLTDAYSLESRLAALYPHNRHIRPKIRQQLQILRDLGFLRFLSPGQYRFT